MTLPPGLLRQVQAARLALGGAKPAAVAQEAGIQKTSLADFRLRYHNDYLGFCALLEIKPKEVESIFDEGTGRIPLRLTSIQLRRARLRSPRDVVLKPRQVKITTEELARDFWFWLMKKGVGVRVICQTSAEHTMLNEISDRFGVYFEALRKNAGLDLDEDGALSIKSRAAWTLADGGSTLLILEAGGTLTAAQKTGRGGTVHRLHTTELAVCEFAGATLAAIMPSIAGSWAGTEVVHESTPNGAGGEERESMKTASGGPLFFWMCQDAKRKIGGFQFVFFSWLDEPEYALPLEPGETIEPITDRERAVVAAGGKPEQLKWYRAQVVERGQDVTDQEYPLDAETCFLVSGRKFFDSTATQRLLDAACDPLPELTRPIHRSGAAGTLRVWRPYTPGKKYVIGGDTSEGTGGDAGGVQVWERGTGLHCATLHGQFRPDELATEAAALGYAYGTAELVIERNNHGHACLQELARAGINADGSIKPRYPAIWVDRDGKLGWNNVEVKRTTALDNLEAALRSGEWKTHDIYILGEIRSFIINKHGRAEAQRGANDDLVLMAAIAWDVLRQVTAPAFAPPPVQTFNQDELPLGY